VIRSGHLIGAHTHTHTQFKSVHRTKSFHGPPPNGFSRRTRPSHEVLPRTNKKQETTNNPLASGVSGVWRQRQRVCVCHCMRMRLASGVWRLALALCQVVRCALCVVVVVLSALCSLVFVFVFVFGFGVPSFFGDRPLCPFYCVFLWGCCVFLCLIDQIRVDWSTCRAVMRRSGSQLEPRVISEVKRLGGYLVSS
jgi:hypothetical protein